MSEYRFEPTPLDDELFVNDVPLTILQDLINGQFDDPIEYRRRDFVKSFITKYEFSIENSLEDDLPMVENYKDNFISYMLHMFDTYLGVGFPDFDDLSVDDQLDIIHMVYRFFIKNIKKNFVNYVYNYIYSNKDTLDSILLDKKDVTSINFKFEIDDEYDIKILANLSHVLDIALSKLNDDTYLIDDFLDMCERDEPILECDYMRELYDTYKITGNFIKDYYEMLIGDSNVDDDIFLPDIQSKIRNLILKKYAHRRKEEEVIEQPVNNESEVTTDSKEETNEETKSEELKEEN